MHAQSVAFSSVDAPQLELLLLAGIAHVRSRREHLNRINVFPVPDSDTGTNLVFTLDSVRRVLNGGVRRTIPELLEALADAALDGARGNSGAILAQYFYGISQSCRRCRVLDGERLARAAGAGAQAAWTAMSEPVTGTLPTVLEDFGDELARRVRAGTRDLRSLFRYGLGRARKSLAGTPAQLPALREAGVVDAGGQGFVDLLDGIWRSIRDGGQAAMEVAAPADRQAPSWQAAMVDRHRYCTECLIEGTGLDVQGLRVELENLDQRSLVIAGGGRRVRVHIHTDLPGQVFRICARYGEIRQHKADDMRLQHGLLNQRGRIAVVTDSGADLPTGETDRLGIHVVPLRLFIGEREYLDKLGMPPAAFYRRLAEPGVHPQTSQPPPADFRRQFELLCGHGLEVLAIHISGRLSGTLQAAGQAAVRVREGRVEVFDCRNAACGQALMVLYAAEAAACGWDMRAITLKLEQLVPKTRTYALVRDLSWGVRGGRVKPWMHALACRLRLNPVLANTVDGRLAARGVIPGRKHALARFGRYLLRRMKRGQVHRILISHTDAVQDARALRDRLLAGHPQVDACWVEEAGPAVGAHAGPGSLIVGVQPYERPVERHA